MQARVKNSVLELLEGDITELDTDAIVNAANAQLVLGAGVAGAIRKKGGPTIQAECDQIGGTDVGGAVITGGGLLKAKHVIHAVGPRMGEGNEDEKLQKATLNALKVAEANQLTSMAFPALSTGIFGFPVERCAHIMLQVAISHLEGTTSLQRLVFCLFSSSSFKAFAQELERVLSQRDCS